jgi:hypothetical protein
MIIYYNIFIVNMSVNYKVNHIFNRGNFSDFEIQTFIYINGVAIMVCMVFIGKQINKTREIKD